MNENIIKSLNELPDILTPDEISEFMRINKSAVNRIIRSGDLKVIRYGGIVRIEKAAFHEWLDKCASGAFTKERKHNVKHKISENKDIHKNMTANAPYPDSETRNRIRTEYSTNAAVNSTPNGHNRIYNGNQNKSYSMRVSALSEDTAADNMGFAADMDKHI